MKRLTLIVTAAIAVLFVISWIVKSGQSAGTDEHNLVHGFLVTFSAFLTLAIFSFLYKDNPYYKFAEHLYVGVSAGYWMAFGFWSTIVGNLIPRISETMSGWFDVPYIPGTWYGPFYSNWMFYVPIIFGIILLMRLSSNYGWISRWSLAFIVGTTAGLNFVRYLRSNFVEQISSTMLPLLVDWHGVGSFMSNLSLSATGQLIAILTNWVIFFGVVCGLIYFFFSKEHTGVFGKASRLGIWILMITFGASFGYTVMGRVSLLVGRITFLFHDWLNLIS